VSVFDLPTDLAAKAATELIADDEKHFAALEQSLADTIADLTDRLETARRAPARQGTQALERDQEVHRLSARLGALRRFGLDLCLGHLVPADGGEVTYIGRLGLTDHTGRRLLLDWRSPAAEPFFGATHADPMGLAGRRRYRWTGGRITDYWDEVFTADGFEGHAASLDDQSAFIAGLGADRSGRMRDVLGTLQADQDAIIRAGSHGALVVDGGPGTGKTVVALHRTAYLLYADPRLGHSSSGVLFVGPSRPYLDYVSDVLPSLGEEGVRTCVLRDLVDRPGVVAEPDPEVARLKASAELVRAVEAAVRFYEEPPAEAVSIPAPWGDIQLSAADLAVAFEAVDGVPHNEAREQIVDELVDLAREQVDEEEGSSSLLDRLVRGDRTLQSLLDRSWPILEAGDVVGDLWSVPAYLHRCAPWLDRADVRRLQRADAQAWTTSDLPFLDAARRRLGDPAASRRRRQEEAAAAAERESRARVMDELIAADDTEMMVMSMLRGHDLQSKLTGAERAADPDSLDGPFAHIVVDEAQELTDAEWQMLVSRCPSGSFTIVGDRAQARRGFPESWASRLERAGLSRIHLAPLTINYRTPEEIMAAAAPEILEVFPNANVPTSIRSNGLPVVHGTVSALDALLTDWLAAHQGTVCVIGRPGRPSSPRVRFLSPELVKGLEFDLVVLVNPASFGSGVEGAVDRYVAMTRATQQLVILTG
jgi:DNA helicase IV